MKPGLLNVDIPQTPPAKVVAEDEVKAGPKTYADTVKDAGQNENKTEHSVGEGKGVEVECATDEASSQVAADDPLTTVTTIADEASTPPVGEAKDEPAPEVPL